MATYLAVPLKRTWEVDLEKPLRTFIANTYSNANPEDYKVALVEFNKLRATMISKSVDKHESALEVLYRYYDQLMAIESKFPISENQIRINFKWQDAFDKESFFSGKRTLSIATSGYEKVCLLFNTAALQSQVAESQNHTSDDGLKLSAKLFMQSSGIFANLRDCVLSHVQNDPTPDLHPDALSALASLMLAQAQDCFCRKAMSDKMKPQIVAKLCHQASDFYADAMKLLQLDSIRALWPKDWVPTAVSKQAGFHALAEFYQSEVSRESKEFGEQIARLKHAKSLIDASETRGGYTFDFKNESKRVGRALEEANKDNDFIYHARVPELSTLPPIGKHAIAKSTPVTEPMSSGFKDLFEKVVPLAVHHALCGFENRKAEIVNGEVGRLREATNLLNSVLASLNLPAAIEDLSGGKVPQSVLEKAAKVRELGGIGHIGKLMDDLPELLQRNKEILDEAEKLLNEEEASDKQLREQFKERWTRTPSQQLTTPIRGEASKYRSIINNAISADGVVKERYGKHRQYIDLLSKSDADIGKALPSGSPVAALQGSPVVKELQKLMEQVNTLKAEREAIEQELKEAQCDMSSKFMTALAQDRLVDEQTLSEPELDRIFGPLRQQVTDSIHRQETCLTNVERANMEFAQARSQNKSAASREEMLKDIAAAFDSFMELRANLEEGTKFYNDLTQLLVKFQSKANDFCFARKTEKEELMKDLQSAIAKQPTTAPPPAPAYQQPTEPSSQPSAPKRQPPARPPPPTRLPNPQASAAPPAQAPPPPAPPAGAPPPGQYAPQAYPTPGAPPYPSYGTPYPAYPPGGYAPPAMPQGYNPYAYYPPQQQPGQVPGQAPGYPAQQGYPGYPPYPQQQQYR